MSPWQNRQGFFFWEICNRIYNNCHSIKATMTKFTKTILDNGLTVLTIPQKEALDATALILVRTGSKYETKDINGISHFLEHMCFKGTKKRPTAFDISSELDRLGAENNAFTAEEYTGYYARVEKGNFNPALEIVSDLFLNPVFQNEEIEKEKGPVIEEINMREDNPQQRIADIFPGLLYGDQPAGWTIAGKRETIASLSRYQVINYRQAHYVAKSTIVVISGGIDEEKTISDIKNYFSGVAQGEKTEKLPVREAQDNPRLLLVPKDSAQTHLILGLRAFGRADPRKYQLQILSAILGGGMSSRLFQRVREKMGAAYYIYASPDTYTDHGYLGIYCGVNHDKLKSVITAILEECQKFNRNMITDEELARAKNQARSSVVLGLTHSMSWALFYGMQEVLDKKIETPEEILEQVNRVTKEEVLQIAGDLFQNVKLNLALIGPDKNEEEFRKLLKF